MTAPIRWNLSPTDSRNVAVFQYLLTTFFGGSLLFGAALALVVFGASALLRLGCLFVPAVVAAITAGIELLFVLGVCCIA